jgi:type IV pilus assembly protein PilO
MTLSSDDLNFAEQASGLEKSSSPGFPVIFGIAFTPQIIGGLAGGIGLLAAGSLILNVIMPAWDNYQQLVTKSNELQLQVTQKRSQAKQLDKAEAELATAKQQQTQVLALFANEQSLDTLLIDTNRLVESTNARVPRNAVRAKLKKFVPITEAPEIITDGSFGPEVDNKLKRSIVDVELEGTFEQTQSIMRNIERLQPLLIIKDYTSQLVPPETSSANDKDKVVLIGPGAITTSFKLHALMPLSPEEAKAEAAKLEAAKAKDKKKK